MNIKDPYIQATIGSAIRWLVAAGAGVLGWTLSEQEREKIAAGLVVIVSFIASIAWSALKNRKLLNTPAPTGGPANAQGENAGGGSGSPGSAAGGVRRGDGA